MAAAICRYTCKIDSRPNFPHYMYLCWEILPRLRKAKRARMFLFFPVNRHINNSQIFLSVNGHDRGNLFLCLAFHSQYKTGTKYFCTMIYIWHISLAFYLVYKFCIGPYTHTALIFTYRICTDRFSEYSND